MFQVQPSFESVVQCNELARAVLFAIVIGGVKSPLGVDGLVGCASEALICVYYQREEQDMIVEVAC